MRIATGLSVLLSSVALSGCPSDDPVSPDGNLRVGTWGGENVAFIVESSVTHIHVGCTNGDFPAPIAVDDQGRFNVSGSYVLRAYPVQVGPPLPAQVAGVVDGRRLTFTIAVNDTVEKKLVVLGPESVTFERDPRMGPCPICVRQLESLEAQSAELVEKFEAQSAKQHEKSISAKRKELR